MVFTIELMTNQGRCASQTEDDGLNVVTCDGKLSVQFEHTVAVTRNGVPVLTLRLEGLRQSSRRTSYIAIRSGATPLRYMLASK